MTKQQAVWAGTHDWYCSYCILDGHDYEVAVKDIIPGTIGTRIRYFKDYEQLRCWAGY